MEVECLMPEESASNPSRTTRRQHVKEELKRCSSVSDFKEPLSRKESIAHLTSEVVLVAQLAIKLWAHLGIGWRWTWNCCRLILYAIILFPGFIQMVFYYYFSKNVERSIPYGRKPRNRLDVYTPCNLGDAPNGAPVLIFITGGAWTIGYKAWGSLFGRRLSEAGVMVVSVDYRNFPQGNALDMIEDVNTGISWVIHHIWRYGGDEDNIHLCGQSAGGHLAAVSLLSQVEKSETGICKLAIGYDWDPLCLQSFIGVSGAYCLETLSDHLHSRGLYKSLFDHIMTIEGNVCLESLSPVKIAQKLQVLLSHRLPEVILLHGKADKTVPYKISVDFARVLEEAGVPCACKVYEDKSHTDPLIEDPLKGGRDQLVEDVLLKVFGHHVELTQKAMVPSFLIRAAAIVCPF